MGWSYLQGLQERPKLQNAMGRGFPSDRAEASRSCCRGARGAQDGRPGRLQVHGDSPFQGSRHDQDRKLEISLNFLV